MSGKNSQILRWTWGAAGSWCFLPFFTVGDVWVGPIPDSRGEHYERLLWGPQLPFVIQALGSPKILRQVVWRVAKGGGRNLCSSTTSEARRAEDAKRVSGNSMWKRKRSN